MFLRAAAWRLTHSSLLENRNSTLDVAEIKRVLESRHLVSSLDGDALHHAQFLSVTGDQVKERQLVKVLGPLVSQFYDLR